MFQRRGLTVTHVLTSNIHGELWQRLAALANESLHVCTGAWLQAIQKGHALGSVRTNAFIVAHSVPTAAPYGRIVYLPTAAGTMNVSA